jgi:MoaA/NifB/PqqE/SkfB family radical SAM enzyme
MYAIDQIAADAVTFRAAVLHGQAYKPVYVKMKIVWTCNLRCGMCNHWREDRDSPLGLAKLKTIVDELAEAGCQKIHLSGGEPTLYRELPALIAHMTTHNLRVTMTTNATLLTRDRATALAEAGLRAANISIDSPDPRLHDRMRGLKGSWKQAVKGFRRLRRALKKGRVRINTVVGRLNYASLVDLPEMAADLGADFINLIPIDEHTGELQRLNKRQILDYNERIAPVIAERALALGLIQQPSQAYPFGVTHPAVERSKLGLYARGYYEDHPCFAPWTHALIDHLGRVSVCCMLREGPILGDLRQQSFNEIWTGAGYTALRTQTDLPLFPTCRRCDDFLDENRQLAALLL